MTSQELIQLFESSNPIGYKETQQLENILQKHPYFQAARAMFLKGLHNESSSRYNSELKKTAAYTQDRSVLFDFITSADFNQDKVALQIKKQEELLRNITVFEPEEVFGRRSIAIDDAIKMKKTESDQVMDPDLFERPISNKPEEKEEIQAERRLEEPEFKEIGTPLEFDASEAHSFSQWLKLTKAKPIERTPEEDLNPNPEKVRKFELIDDFISKSPKIKPGKSSGTVNIAKDRTTPPEALMTETLARVYLEQNNYKKAIQAYKILILKNPEKSGFFADQIRAIKKLQENNTGQE
ncbi:hypothetical protein L1I30_00495 [Gillisia sp. M10.2A]|uniref:Tetratricopeptide repeat protein n=1 Tax=Gillisia lutea TaxID=2909668 RepID=A0ABS9ED11_9FLAO|nr:hypothetical protein [Gillisia lutea]MCF4100132.1 hypothetical protein [Gillisia lutea]